MYYEQGKSIDLNTGSIINILKRIADERTDNLYIQFLGGEPFHREDIFDILQECDKHGIDFAIATNGTLLNNEKLKRLCDLNHLKNICFSIDSHDPAVSNILCGHKSWEQSVMNLSRLLNLRVKQNVTFSVGIESVLTRYNANIVEATIKWASSLGVNYWACDSLKNPFGNLSKKDIALSKSKLYEIGRNVALIAIKLPNFKIRIDWGLPLFKSYINGIAGRDICGGVAKRCSAGTDSVWIGNAGNVQPCAYTNSFSEFRSSLIEGFNLKKKTYYLNNVPLHDIMGSRYFKDFYRFVHTVSAKRNYQICNHCRFQDTCELCPLDIMHYGEQSTKSCFEFIKWKKENEYEKTF
jgi:MoaA/NifB/PqqE/SkfB family radical SAM enzyme